jgi:hypothetical protein
MIAGRTIREGLVGPGPPGAELLAGEVAGGRAASSTRPIAAAPYYGNRDRYECGQYLTELRANDDKLRTMRSSEPLMSDEARRIWVDGIVEGIPSASEAVLIELRFLLDDDDRCTKLLARNDELLNLIDRCLERYDAAGAH